MSEERTNCLEPAGSRLFRSGMNGLWYRNPRAAGYVDCVEIDGKRLERREAEHSLDFIRRLGQWSEEIYSENSPVLASEERGS